MAQQRVHHLNISDLWVPTHWPICMIWFFTSHQQSLSYAGTGIPGLNQYYQSSHIIYTININGNWCTTYMCRPFITHLDDLVITQIWIYPCHGVAHKFFFTMEIFAGFICLFCCFKSQINSYGHGEMVSSPNHTFSSASLNKQLISTSWQQSSLNDSAEGRRMTEEIIS